MLRAYRVTTVSLVIYVAALWGVGLAGGYALAFDSSGLAPRSLQGALGFWSAATAGLTLAALALSGFLVWMLRRQKRELARAAFSGVSGAAGG